MDGYRGSAYRIYIVIRNLRGHESSLPYDWYNFPMKLVDKEISIAMLKKMSHRVFGGLVKAVVDVKKEVMVVDADMHADEETFLLEKGSHQDDLWGINLYPELSGESFIEYDSMINLRPRLHNFSRNVEDKKIREKIKAIVSQLVKL